MCKWGHTGADRGPRQLGTPLRDRITVPVPNFGRYLRTLNPGRCSPALRTPAERTGARNTTSEAATPESRTSTTDDAGRWSREVEDYRAPSGKNPSKPRSATPGSRRTRQRNPPLEQRTSGLVTDGVEATPQRRRRPGRTDRNQPAPSRRGRSEYTWSVAPTETAAAGASRHDSGRQRRCGEAASPRATAPAASPRGDVCLPVRAVEPAWQVREHQHASGAPPGSVIERERPRGEDNLVTSCNED